jgi:hypothetical protein
MGFTRYLSQKMNECGEWVEGYLLLCQKSPLVCKNCEHNIVFFQTCATNQQNFTKLGDIVSSAK